MAKSGFWLRGAKGKLAGTVLYQSNGSTVQREIVTPKNPQSNNQMRQRATFAGAAKFYQNAQQNRFVLAFQNKKNNQSNFNAFMQRNLREFDTLTYPTREQATTPEFCNYFPWICTEGNLQGIGVAFPDDGLGSLGCAINVQVAGETYVQNWDELIALNPSLNLQYGDIITLTVVINDEVFNDTTLDVVVGNITPRWITRQFIIGADLDGYTLEQYLAVNGLAFNVNTIDGKVCIGLNMDDVCEELGINAGIFNVNLVSAMVCVTRSRNEGSQLKVSTSRFSLDDMAQRIFERLSNDTQMREAIESYKNSANSNIEPANILQGSVAEDVPVSDIYYKSGSNEVHVNAPATGLDFTQTEEEGFDVHIYGIASNNDINPAKLAVICSASGFSYSVKAETRRKMVPEDHTYKAYRGAVVTLKLSSSGAPGSPFTIKYDGIAVASGNFAS